MVGCECSGSTAAERSAISARRLARPVSASESASSRLASSRWPFSFARRSDAARAEAESWWKMANALNRRAITIPEPTSTSFCAALARVAYTRPEAATALWTTANWRAETPARESARGPYPAGEMPTR